jgi:hypothetical protein
MFSRLFGKSSFLGDDLEPWRLETWAWLMRNLGGVDHLKSTPLATPSREFFPPSDAKGHDRALHIFGSVKTMMGMEYWDCVLKPYNRREANAQVGEYWFLRTRSAPNGVFQMKDGVAQIGYASDLVSKPADLVGVFAHELCHYRLAAISEPSPGGPETHELDTDLAVAYAGFGVFGANRAFDFEQHGDAFGQDGAHSAAAICRSAPGPSRSDFSSL